jgi:hypothetical protein
MREEREGRRGGVWPGAMSETWRGETSHNEMVNPSLH